MRKVRGILQTAMLQAWSSPKANFADQACTRRAREHGEICGSREQLGQRSQL